LILFELIIDIIIARGKTINID